MGRSHLIMDEGRHYASPHAAFGLIKVVRSDFEHGPRCTDSTPIVLNNKSISHRNQF